MLQLFVVFVNNNSLASVGPPRPSATTRYLVVTPEPWAPMRRTDAVKNWMGCQIHTNNRTHSQHYVLGGAHATPEEHAERRCRWLERL